MGFLFFWEIDNFIVYRRFIVRNGTYINFQARIQILTVKQLKKPH